MSWVLCLGVSQAAINAVAVLPREGPLLSFFRSWQNSVPVVEKVPMVLLAASLVSQSAPKATRVPLVVFSEVCAALVYTVYTSERRPSDSISWVNKTKLTALKSSPEAGCPWVDLPFSRECSIIMRMTVCRIPRFHSHSRTLWRVWADRVLRLCEHLAYQGIPSPNKGVLFYCSH